ncbi:MAG: ABC transporter ATP-binding protein [Rubinisphaera brasiliensis]|uniref:Fe(3+)-transporting ATPase n=1 Tax=Rubinisphaera brasiliensis (strain ATCC 49424 / DSM 5305 / JCM 21570 / IAM 15109 / NBRC 103401 / IFAM 1448) TaxID=756272 RepID=F0SS57_RUBBR|nr:MULTISPECIES: ABC transporter ATP-binding protein [Rubinisphaera]ADY58068.1 Fe(3+)-transporting ATPase [Rubinisphaera brasiliensis DSM 5305]MBB02185.1 ABC transporter ATP-binding protein [Planctomyces sp.]MBR9800759.1 ABC transporter ATP-binding protein [bacterium]
MTDLPTSDLDSTTSDSPTQTDGQAPQVNVVAETAPAGNGEAPSRPAPTLEIRNLHRFFGKLKAVNNVSFTAYPGQVMGFIGPNGAGKTTTMRIIATLDLPTAGDAFVCGNSVVDDPEKVRKVIGFMPDSFGKYSNMDVVEYLDFYARAYGFKGEERREAVERVLIFTELRKIADKPIKNLSKGMSQRLGLGRTLIHDPQVLVLDEPAAGLDPRARVELRELIHLLAVEMNKTVLISSHILTELGEICDSAAIIEAGEILVHGTIEELKRRRPRKEGQDETGDAIAVAVVDRSNDLRKFLLEQPYVSHVGLAANRVVFEFRGDDSEKAKLLKRMIDADFRVIEFAAKSETLEDAFMAITQGLVQ